MSLPINKVLMAAFRYANRPLNSMIKSAIKSWTNPQESRSLLIRAIMKVGQYAFRFENFMTKSIVKDENVLTKEKSDEKAKKDIGE